MVRAEVQASPTARTQRCSGNNSDIPGPWRAISDKSMSTSLTLRSRNIAFNTSAKARNEKSGAPNEEIWLSAAMCADTPKAASSESKMDNSCTCTAPCADHTLPTSTPD